MSEWIEITLRLGLATLAGVLLGANRWLHHKSAGVKTHALASTNPRVSIFFMPAGVYLCTLHI
jgi:putative Mg2+ transporter-C (MgtC) family protein